MYDPGSQLLVYRTLNNKMWLRKSLFSILSRCIPAVLASTGTPQIFSVMVTGH